MKTERQDTLVDLLNEALLPFQTRLDKHESDMVDCLHELKQSIQALHREQKEIRNEQLLQSKRIEMLESKLATAGKQLSSNSWDLREISESQLRLESHIETLSIRSLSYETELRKLKRIKLQD
ncbi:hypothetical protein QR721_09395 [Aciduricibacillus chroicocephali]|uniref:Uncharacterized protein n=1 Tax=Aciduricibacillus chroicocephali TaxID=3054939 RepID=A0ABY9KUB4_9BACI|nr:hypothetical protein QR721_09395 [Bacillaceae bacterium 44XB]